jgi:hypothetical protein
MTWQNLCLKDSTLVVELFHLVGCSNVCWVDRISKTVKLRNRGQYSSNRIHEPEKSACGKWGNRGHERHGLNASWRGNGRLVSRGERRT